MNNPHILQEYTEHENRKLNKLAYSIFSKYGGLNFCDYDDFYSIANEQLWQATEKYNPNMGVPFEAFLRLRLSNKFKQEMTRRNRCKRSEKRENEDGSITYERPISLNAYVIEDDGVTVEDTLVSTFDMDKEIGILEYDGIEEYLESLTPMQRRIVELRMDGYEKNDIIDKLNITDSLYEKQISRARSYDCTKNLNRNKILKDKEEEAKMDIVTTTNERGKNTSYAISSIIKQMRNHQIRDNHPLQRESKQWNLKYASELISDILQGKTMTQIIVSEEIKGRISMHWLIDGKQRCTNMIDFFNDGFAISKKVQRYMIEYQVYRKDENGEDVLNEDGFSVADTKVFDIRGKRFSQFPEELQDKFLDYQYPVLMNLNCDKREIAYDIARFNRCRPMNVAQNGWTGMDEELAEYIDGILKLPFFLDECDKSSYTQSNLKSGMLRRMIVESVMAIDFLDNFNKDFGKMCSYISENASDGNFADFYVLVEQIIAVADQSVAHMFNIKNSFLWFALFSRFKKLGLEDGEFINFLREFDSSLHSAEVNGESFDMLNEKSTKDKSVVIKKLDHLEQMMNEYFGIDKAEDDTAKIPEDLVDYVKDFGDYDIVKEMNIRGSDSISKVAMETLDFTKSVLGKDKTDEDVELYLSILDEWTANVAERPDFLNADSLPSFVGLIGYSCDKEIDTDAVSWFSKFIDSNTSIPYSGDQEKQYHYMIQSLQGYMKSI